jgi:hypothetical protein
MLARFAATSAALVLLAESPVAAQIGFEGFEFQVNTYTTSVQAHGRVARLSDGRFVVVYDSQGQDGDSDGVFARIYQAGGAGPLGEEFQINEHTPNAQHNPAVAALPDAEFVVVWESFRQIATGSNDDLFGRRFASDGTPVGTEFQINQETISEQTLPNVASRADGTFAVSWASEDQDGDREGVFARIFSLDGTPLLDEFQVNTYTTNRQTPARAGASSVMWTDDDHFVVTWQSYGQDGSENSIQARVFHDDGEGGDEFQVNQTTDGNQANPAAGSNGDGTYVLVWNERQFDSQTLLRRYDAHDGVLTDETPVGDSTSQSKPAISVEESGTFTLAWSDVDANTGGIVGRRYDATAQPLSPVFVVNTYQTALQQDPQVLVGPGDEFIVLWESIGQDGDQHGVFGQRFAGQGLCGDATYDETITASDALAILRCAVGSVECSVCVCDVNGSGVSATDALTVLKLAVGQAVTLTCPAC